MYISITGLKYKGLAKTLRFWFFTIPAFASAKKAKGNLFAAEKKVGEYQHTLTAWKTRDDMMSYIHDKYHSRAMKQFSSIGSGSTYGFEAEEIPSWESALKIWKENFNLQK